MEFENEYLWGRAMARPYRCGIMDGKFMIIVFFVVNDVHIVPIFDGILGFGNAIFIAMEF